MGISTSTTRSLAVHAGAVVLLLGALAGCGGSSSSGDGHPRETTLTLSEIRIPESFPIAQGLTADGDTRVTQPRRAVKGIRLDGRCWGTTWPAQTVDRLVVQQSGPELAVTRELVQYEDEATAARVVNQVRTRAERCHHLPATSDMAALDVTTYDADPHVASFSETISGGQPGGSVFELTQVGSAILAVEDSSEWTPDSAVDGVRELERADRAVVSRMCVFTDAGC